MNLHNEIMNIRVDTKIKELDYTDVDGCVDEDWMSYKEGHRDARHAAAELSLKAEARIEELESTIRILLLAITPVANTAYNIGQSHQEWDRIRENIRVLDELRTQAYKLLESK